MLHSQCLCSPVLRSVGTGIVLCSMIVGGLLAQDAANSAGAVAAKAKKAAAGRLPNHYARLDLSDKQREQVYAVQAKYKVQIEELESQLELQKGKRDAEIEGVLTSDQRRKLKSLIEEARKKAEARKSAADKSLEQPSDSQAAQ